MYSCVSKPAHQTQQNILYQGKRCKGPWVNWLNNRRLLDLIGNILPAGSKLNPLATALGSARR
jgi:hypothetical protein